MNTSPDYCADIQLACKILVKLKLDSGPFGNISIRAENKDQFYINPMGVTFDQIQKEDVLLMNLHQQDLHEAHPGAVIHREIYLLRKDVQAIVHTHSENTVLMSLLGSAIKPFTQLGASIFSDQAIYHGFSGPVRDSNEGLAIARALEYKSIVIAKNHGLFATSHCIQAALWDMVVADSAAKIHLEAKKIGIEEAGNMSIADLEKSRVEVREKQFRFMWKQLGVGL